MTEVSQLLRDELSIIKRSVKARSIEEKKAARQELREKAAMKLVRQFMTLPYGVNFIQNLDKALLAHEQLTILEDRLGKIKDKLNSTGMHEQIRKKQQLRADHDSMCEASRRSISSALVGRRTSRNCPTTGSPSTNVERS